MTITKQINIILICLPMLAYWYLVSGEIDPEWLDIHHCREKNVALENDETSFDEFILPLNARIYNSSIVPNWMLETLELRAHPTAIRQGAAYV